MFIRDRWILLFFLWGLKKDDKCFVLWRGKFLSGFTHQPAHRHPRLSFGWRSFAVCDDDGGGGGAGVCEW